MTEKLVEILIMEGVAALLLAFAYLIGIKGRMDLIAGYNERSAARVTDKDGLRRLVARCCLLIGIASAVMPLMTWYFGMVYAIGGYGGFILGVIGMVMLQARDFTR